MPSHVGNRVYPKTLRTPPCQEFQYPHGEGLGRARATGGGWRDNGLGEQLCGGIADENRYEDIRVCFFHSPLHALISSRMLTLTHPNANAHAHPNAGIHADGNLDAEHHAHADQHARQPRAAGD